MKRLSGIFGAGVLLTLAFIAPASAQQVNNYCWVSNGPPVQWAPCSATNPLAITGGGGGGLSVVDSSSWTTSVSPFTPSGGVFNDAATLSTGTQGTFRLTTKRAQVIDTDTTGNALYSAITAATPAGANTIGNVKIVDTAGTNLATVKPASTAPVAADTSFVVGLNPNSPGIINDPCASGTRLSAPINVTTPATTSLVAVSGATVVYVCGFAMTVAPSASTADTALFEYGTGAACTGPVVLTGTFGNGEVPAVNTTAPVSVTYGGGLNTVFKSAASNGVCILTAGTVVNVQGVLTYVQQ